MGSRVGALKSRFEWQAGTGTFAGTGRSMLFARNFFRYPKMLGTPIPSPRALINEVLGRVNWREARVLVEYGPGVGDFTGEMLARMRSDARLLALETNADFVRYLKDSLPDPRLHVTHASAGEVGNLLSRSGSPGADYVISGIPFSTIPADAREEILGATCEALQPRGEFLAYQYSRRVLPSLSKIFGHVRGEFRWLGFLPIWLFHCVP